MSSGGHGEIREPKYCSDGNLVGKGDFVLNTDTQEGLIVVRMLDINFNINNRS